MIDGSFTTASPNHPIYAIYNNFEVYLPSAKIGGGNFLYVWSGGGYINGHASGISNNINYFGLSSITMLSAGPLYGSPGLSVAQANNIDTKIDDGLPTSGVVTAQYLSANVYWTSGYPYWNYGPIGASAIPPSSNTCFDNGNVYSSNYVYSMAQDGGNNINCALSFEFQ